MDDLKQWIADMEREQQLLEEEQDYIEHIETTKVSVGVRMSAHDAEMIKIFAKKYNQSVSSICAQMLSFSIRESIKALNEDIGDWLLQASKNLQEKK